tara:strand:+ start:9695 stop:10210 length:516 start_codon:yes stop_codon:yes gene_type:complete
MDTCPECGNHDMRSVKLDSGTVIECGLCGEQFGERRAVTGSSLSDEAEQRRIDPIIWPLARILERLPGMDLGATSAGGAASLPYVDLVVVGQDALRQIENLAKSMRLVAGSLRCRWRIEARFEHTLVFLIAPAVKDTTLRDARIDIEVLAQCIERDMRLTWWRHANVAENG